MTESEPIEIVWRTAPEAAFEELDVHAPLVGIIMGSKSDLPAMEKAELGTGTSGGSGARCASCPPIASPTRWPSSAPQREDARIAV